MSSHDIDEIERLADWVAVIDEGRLLFAEQVVSLLRRFRRVEVIGTDMRTPARDPGDAWIAHESSGRTLRFIDTAHEASDAGERLVKAFPEAEIRVAPMSLREIFIVMARERVNGTPRVAEVRA